MVVGVTVIGCGSSKGGDSGTLTRDDFATQANTICKESDEAASNLAAPSDMPGGAVYFGELRSLVADVRRRLTALTPPAAQRSTFDQMLDSLRDELGTLAEIRDAMAAGHLSEAQTLVKAMQASPFEGEAAALGLSACVTAVHSGG